MSDTLKVILVGGVWMIAIQLLAINLSIHDIKTIFEEMRAEHKR